MSDRNIMTVQLKNISGEIVDLEHSDYWSGIREWS